MKSGRVKGCGIVLSLAVTTVIGGCGTAESTLPEQGGAPAHVVTSRSEPTTALELLEAMHRTYSDSWYRTLSFKQTVTRVLPDGTRAPDEVWSEWAEVPGRLRIDLGAEHNGNGVIYRSDSLYAFRGGELAVARAERNPLMVLGFDVYAQSPARSAAVLEEEGFDLSKMRRDTWQGRPVYVVGADAGDLTSRQFWVERERLLFVRLLEPLSQDTTKTMDIRFDAYEPLAGGWIAPLVVVLLDGREVMREEYFDVVANPELPADIFEPASWGPLSP